MIDLTSDYDSRRFDWDERVWWFTGLRVWSTEHGGFRLTVRELQDGEGYGWIVDGPDRKFMAVGVEEGRAAAMDAAVAAADGIREGK